MKAMTEREFLAQKGLADPASGWCLDKLRSNKDIPVNRCFACEAVKSEDEAQFYPALCGCVCPLGGEFGIGCGFGLYTKWLNACTIQRRSQLAGQIASLPWITGKDTMERRYEI